MKLIPQKLTRAVGRQILKSKKNSPHIFFGLGVVGVVGAGVLACRATLKLEDTVDEIKDDFKQVKDRTRGTSEFGTTYTDHEYYRDLGYVYGTSTVKVAKLYGPSVVLGGLSIAALTGSHVQLTRRNTALTFTLAAVSKAFDDYRVRVQDEIGEEREQDIYRAVSDETDPETKKVLKVVDADAASVYMRSFDSANSNWKGDSELNRIFIQCQQNYANQILHSRGHIFLNEVYDQLGFARSQPGQIMGWIVNGDGDGYVDFGLFEAYNQLPTRDQNFILDFNVDGVIYDRI